ncbi:bifunctional glycosyltransferase/CDP-glycerol:glycerophosphate glycerophosphotransferase [Mesobacillus maritimus]|uniref:CDP-glycerol:glycerophosphate glycerophosphotransferase n=1 Tax=Mesobacillus maritimus TaxID=1643336 RepID=A0ABS7K4D6_9BACI|nr:CDP-glycerol:glycerophosphate glycerophosphotransferase [Mesobacillus maritimus]MBY0097112.1 CDP-glycerol:glycerophosphate glycerophosphotransferase [Mesobacillus maritimus]
MNTHQEQKVSIIMPYYNTSEFVRDSLSSVLSQTYRNLELVIINDGSNTEETEYLESLLVDDRIIYRKNETNKGVAFARNSGLKFATGEMIYFLDSDDILVNDTIELLIKNIHEYPAIFGTTKKLLRPSDLDSPSDMAEVLVNLEKSSSLFNGGSILNVLIKRDFIIDKAIHFLEDTKGSTDITGIIPFIDAKGTLPKVNRITYYKRVRNDPITNPSLAQRPIEEVAKDFITVYTTLKELPTSENVKIYLDQQLINFYRRNVTRTFNVEEKFDELFAVFGKAVKMMDSSMIQFQPRHIKSELNHLKKGNKAKFKRVLKLHIEALELKGVIVGNKSLKRYIYKKAFLKLPMKENYIVFESFLGKNYSDSPRNIYEYITENNLKFKCVWVFNDKNRKIPGDAKVVKRFSLAYYYYLAVSKYWVNNMRQPLHLVKRKDNIFLETWHGTPLKKLVFDMKDVYSANPRYKRDFFLQSRAWDYLLSPNRYSSDIFRSAFKFEKEMLEYGYPRNDLLYAPDRMVRASQIKKALGIPEEKKVVLYAPTWRDDDFYEPGKYKFDLKLDLKKMKDKLGEQYVVALRMHYFIADNLNIEGLEGFAYNLSKYDDIAELYLISDILITDYSSVFFDYANLKRPILFYTYDLEKYRDQLRGFYIDFENEAPGPLLKTSGEVIETIQNIELIEKTYEKTYEEFYEKFCSWHDGKSTEKIVKRVFMSE